MITFTITTNATSAAQNYAPDFQPVTRVATLRARGTWGGVTLVVRAGDRVTNANPLPIPGGDGLTEDTHLAVDLMPGTPISVVSSGGAGHNVVVTLE